MMLQETDVYAVENHKAKREQCRNYVEDVLNDNDRIVGFLKVCSNKRYNESYARQDEEQTTIYSFLCGKFIPERIVRIRSVFILSYYILAMCE